MPLAARVSILHRLTGLLLIVSVPVLLALLDRSLSGPAGFESVRVGSGHDRWPSVIAETTWRTTPINPTIPRSPTG